MPLLVLSAAEAFKQIRRTYSRWPRTPESQAERLMPLAQPGFWPSFTIDKREPIFTVGSCFARNIEKQLIHEGYNVAARDWRPPEDTGFRADPDALLNRYVIWSIANELKWGFGHGKPFKRKALLHVGKDRWFDPHLHPLVSPGPLEAVETRRAAINAYMRMAAEARVIIMTLGLAEAWFDTLTGYYLNGVLPTRVREIYGDRFQFHLLDYDQIVQGLNFIHQLLTRYGRPDFKMLVTVSPVAMNTTFTGGEVLVANTYSKAVQRAAVEAFVRSHDNVDYFPSYESVILSDRRRAWRDDQAHASDEIVRLNVLRMIEAYADRDGAETSDQASRATQAFALVQAAREAAGLDAPDETIAAYRAAVAIAPEEGLILLEFGRFLHEQKAFDEAAEVVLAATGKGAGRYGGFYNLAQIYSAAKRYDDAWTALAKAREFQPTRLGVLDLSANVARRLGRLDEALAFAEKHLAMEPASETSKARLEALREEARTRASGPARRRLGFGAARRRKAQAP